MFAIKSIKRLGRRSFAIYFRLRFEAPPKKRLRSTDFDKFLEILRLAFFNNMVGLMKMIQILTQKLGEDEDEIQGIIAALVTIVIDEIVEVAAFKCPCVAESDLAIPYTAAFPRRDKELYAYLFILVPSFILLMAALSFN